MNDRIHLIKELAQPCSQLCREYYNKKQKTWNKKDTSILTEADLKVNDLICSAIRKEFPQDAILSEELEDDKRRFSREYLWIIDPIDGTSEFIKGSPEHCIMICLLRDSKPIYASVVIPQENNAFFGGPEQGLELTNLQSQRSIHINDLSHAKDVLIISKSRTREIVLRFAQKYNLKTQACGSAGVKAARILQGRARHYFHINPIHEWDTAAPDCLLRSLKLPLLDLSGQVLIYNKKIPKHENFIFSLDENILDKAKDFFSQ